MKKIKQLTGLVAMVDKESATLYKATRCLMGEHDIILRGRPVKLTKLAEQVPVKKLAKEIEQV